MTTTLTPVVATRHWTSTRALLTAAAAAGPVFFTSVAGQMLLRDGFDLRVHPISQLAIGDLGWIQITTFVLAGLGVIGLAIAHRRVVTDGIGRRLVPLFVSVFGLGLIVAGLFVMDPQHGFPAGTPDGPAPQMSWHSIVHSAAAAVAYTGLAAACVVLVVRSIKRRAVLPAIANGLVGLILLLPVSPTDYSLQTAFNALVGFAWVTVYALHLRRV
ncbi:DUF998 domain-containing protein [Kribbella swartbergensis]